MKKLIIKQKLILIALVGFSFSSCGSDELTADSFDCSCDDVKKKNGKFYQSGLHKNGDHVDIGKLFSGTCGTLDDKGKVIAKGKFDNGYILEGQEWKNIDDKLYQTVDMKYDNNKYHEGYKMKLERNLGFLYPTEYTKYKAGKDVAHYSMVNGYGKTIVSGDFGDGFFETPCLMEGYDIDKYELLNFLECVEKEKLPKFFFVNGDNVKNKSKTTDNSTNKTEVKVEETYEEDNAEIVDESVTEEKIDYFQISDPDGYSNLRDVPNGEIIRKVYDTEIFEVIGTENKHKEVLFEDGTTGFIHESRVIKL